MTTVPSRSATAHTPARDWAEDEDAFSPDGNESGGADLNRLYRAHSSRLLRYLAGRTGSREEARDLVQETFSNLLRFRRGGCDDMRRPEAYLRRVARNLAARRPAAAAHLQIISETDAIAGPDPHRLLETRDMLRRVEAAMQKLKPKTREIFMAHRLDGMSYAEIAERTGLSVKGVEKQMSKAIAHLDRMLDRT